MRGHEFNVLWRKNPLALQFLQFDCPAIGEGVLICRDLCQNHMQHLLWLGENVVWLCHDLPQALTPAYNRSFTSQPDGTSAREATAPSTGCIAPPRPRCLVKSSQSKAASRRACRRTLDCVTTPAE